jgi:hypothetical protein
MNPELAAAILKWAVPVVMQVIRERRAVKLAAGEDPSTVTDEEVIAAFNSNIDRFLAEGEAWRAEHPSA